MLTKKHSRWVLLGILAITCFQVFQIPALRYAYETKDFFPSEDEDLRFYEQFQARFESDNDFLLLALVHEEGVFDADFLPKVAELTQELKAHPALRAVHSPTDFKLPIKSAMGMVGKSLLHPEKPNRYAKDSVFIFENFRFVGNFFSKKAPALALQLNINPALSEMEGRDLLNELETLLENYGFDAFYIAGKLKTQRDFSGKIADESRLFFGAGVGLIILFLLFAYRSWWGVVVPMAVILLAIAWLLGLVGLLRDKLNIMTALLPVIVMVVGMSDVVHILTKFLDEIRQGKPKKEALQITLKEVGWATFFTSLTTGIGFFTLLTARILPIRDLGMFSGFGVAIAYLLAFSLLPAVLILLPQKQFKGRLIGAENWDKQLNRLFDGVMQRKKTILWATLVFLGVAAWGMSRIHVDSYLIESVSDKDPLMQHFNFFEENFAGARPFEMAIEVKDSSKTIFDEQIAQQIHRLENELLADSYGVNFLASPVQTMQIFNYAYTGAFAFPKDTKTFEKVQKELRKLHKKGKLKELISKDGRHIRLTGKMKDWGSHEIGLRNRYFSQHIENQIDTSLIAYRFTGGATLVDKNNRYLIGNMFQGLGIAFGVIALMMGLMFRSWRMLFISLVPNLIPLLVVAAVMGFFGIDMKTPTSIVFTIGFGIAVDDTIHFMSRLKLELSKEKNLLDALRSSFIHTGKAIIITSLILICGFSLLMFSSFGGTFFTGMLISLTLIFAVIADLLLLPILIFYAFPK